MLELDVKDIDGRHGSGHVRFGKDHPSDNIAELTVTNPATGNTVSVLLGHRSAVWLMAHLGACITDMAIEFDIAVMDQNGTDYQGVIQVSNADGANPEIRVTNNTDGTTATVVLDRQAATDFMAELGAFITTT